MTTRTVVAEVAARVEAAEAEVAGVALVEAARRLAVQRAIAGKEVKETRGQPDRKREARRPAVRQERPALVKQGSAASRVAVEAALREAPVPAWAEEEPRAQAWAAAEAAEEEPRARAWAAAEAAASAAAPARAAA
jgi:hypothetical protein